MWHLPRTNARWSYELLDGEDRPLGALDGVLPGGSLEVAALSRLGGSGSLTIKEMGQGINWMSHRVRITYHPGISGLDPWPVATMMFTSPKERHTELGLTYEVGLLPKTRVIDEPKTGLGYSVNAGTPIIAHVVGMIEALGETRIAVTPSAAVLASTVVWDPGTSHLTIINDLLTAAGYWSLWVDGSGQFRVEPYQLPGARPITRTFEKGDASIHYPEWGREQDLASVPNVARVYREGDDTTAGIEGIARDDDPRSPFSTVSRGFEIHRDPESAEVTTIDAANLLARRRLIDAQSPVAKLDVTHAVVPLDPNQVVEFIPEPGVRKLATIQRMSYRLTFDGVVSAEWREI